jgi:peptidoglycan/LPS O-acetylase OafA/YrhL
MSETSKLTKHFDYIDALRGYAILLVIAVHATLTFSNLSPTTMILTGQGARGVQLFFVASAMTLWMSWEARNDGARAFYVRRFFRIAPMFYLSLPIFLSLGTWGPTMYAPEGIGLRHIVMAATFTHGFMADTITSVVPGSWSIADEMMFYAIFPLLMAIRVRISTAFALVVVGTIGCIALNGLAGRTLASVSDDAWRGAWGNFYFLWFPNQFPCFLFGMLVARWIHEDRPTLWPPLLVLGSIALAVVDGLYPLPVLKLLSVPMQFGVIFALFALGLSKWQPTVLVNPVICWIGKVSYSGYLVHFLLIALGSPFPRENYLEAFVSLAALTVAISSLTYALIEKPFIRLGSALIARAALSPERRVTDAA